MEENIDHFEITAYSLANDIHALIEEENWVIRRMTLYLAIARHFREDNREESLDNCLLDLKKFCQTLEELYDSPARGSGQY